MKVPHEAGQAFLVVVVIFFPRRDPGRRAGQDRSDRNEPSGSAPTGAIAHELAQRVMVPGSEQQRMGANSTNTPPRRGTQGEGVHGGEQNARGPTEWAACRIRLIRETSHVPGCSHPRVMYSELLATTMGKSA